jgi:hypothetical protein
MSGFCSSLGEALEMKKDFRTQNLLSEFALSPKFIEHDGCVFLIDGFSEETYSRWLNFYRGVAVDKRAVESIMNHRHVSELFVNEPPEPSRRLVNDVGRLLEGLWLTKLKVAFPDRDFVVRYFPDEQPSSSEITFCQKQELP